MIVGELFAGIGGFGLGLERAGARVAWQVEINEQARGVLARHWPGVARHEDVREVGAGTLEAVDVVAGGFPCQDLSIAGRRAGLGGERSGLWWEFHRIVSELRPRWVFAENVPGLLSSNGGRDMGTVLGSLAQLGYGYAYRVLDARFFGLAQRRARVLIVGCLGDWRRAAQVLLEPEGVRGDPAPRGEARADVASPLGSQPAGGGWRDDLDRAGAFIVSSAGSCERKSHGRAAGIARALDTSGGFTVGQGGTVVAGTLSPGAHPGGFNGQDAERGMLVAFDRAQITSGENRSNPQPGQPCHALNGEAPLVASAVTAREGKGPDSDATTTLVPAAVGFRWAASAARSMRVDETVDPLRSQGGGAGIPAVAYACQGSNVGPAGALRAGHNHTNSVPFVGVRRLTPTECERLQGFPDGWTAEGVDGPQSDSARYRQLGNAVPPPMVEWVGRRIARCA